MLLSEFCVAIGIGSWFDYITSDNCWLTKSLMDTFHIPSCDTVEQQLQRTAVVASDSGSSELPLANSSRTPSDFTSSSSDSTASSLPSTPLSSRPATSTPTTKELDPLAWQQPKVEFQVGKWNFALRWIIACYSIGRYRQVLPSKDGKSLVYRISVQVSSVSIHFGAARKVSRLTVLHVPLGHRTY